MQLNRQFSFCFLTFWFNAKENSHSVIMRRYYMHRLQSSSSHYSSFTQSYYCVSYSIRVLLIYLWQNSKWAYGAGNLLNGSQQTNKQFHRPHNNNSTVSTKNIVPPPPLSHHIRVRHQAVEERFISPGNDKVRYSISKSQVRCIHNCAVPKQYHYQSCAIRT